MLAELLKFNYGVKWEQWKDCIGSNINYLLSAGGALSAAWTVRAYVRPTNSSTPGAMVIRPVVLLMMKSPLAPTRISYVISPFDPSSASTAVSWNWKWQHKSSGVNFSLLYHFSSEEEHLAFKDKKVSKESCLGMLLFSWIEFTVFWYDTKAIVVGRLVFLSFLVKVI